MKAPIGSIKITNRVRKEITKIEELAEDIQNHGLLNPITVMSLNGLDSKSGGEFRLLAGLRRLKAVESLGLDEIAINIVSPADAEAALRIEISENEQREPFTFSEKMDFARMLEEIEREKAKARMLAGKKVDGDDLGDDPPPQGAEGQKGETREIVAEKIGMGKTNYDRAKYIVDNAPDEIIDELDKGERTIRKTYDELRAKNKAGNTDSAEGTTSNLPSESSTPNLPPPKPKPLTSDELMQIAEQEAVERNKVFNNLSAEEKLQTIQELLDKECRRAITAESELENLRAYHKNLNYHNDCNIKNLTGQIARLEGLLEESEARLAAANARIAELEAMQSDVQSC